MSKLNPMLAMDITEPRVWGWCWARMSYRGLKRNIRAALTGLKCGDGKLLLCVPLCTMPQDFLDKFFNYLVKYASRPRIYPRLSSQQQIDSRTSSNIPSPLRRDDHDPTALYI
ncbi:predicted protein [Sclerotinia sclerotiorum 1980 UF-70]|uniref:Uncharacterized protein n=1 Tax=Sclerotinia sclerotiorum (strain ATCC 18683 / 1980 / Ss-1) TaxID=665079 RepID=A7EJD9_SCLS1|nr:predicted protein [Sclerotinia sclerotiorum 1980 UF-70]EDO02955.1 predicted protein [Sclerotinia sclerotiorum 1980 UF-70]